MPKLFDAEISGNCYKVRLLLAQLGIAYERVAVDVTRRGDRPRDLLAHNPIGKAPLLLLDDGRGIAESGAILWHLARTTPYLPDEPAAQEEVLRWMFFEQNLLEPTVAVNRWIITVAGRKEELAQVVAFNHSRGEQALDAMAAHLARRPFFVSDRYTIADIALYAYTHVAEEGGFELVSRPALRAWIARVEAQPDWVPMISH